MEKLATLLRHLSLNILSRGILFSLDNSSNSSSCPVSLTICGLLLFQLVSTRQSCGILVVYCQLSLSCPSLTVMLSYTEHPFPASLPESLLSSRPASASANSWSQDLKPGTHSHALGEILAELRAPSSSSSSSSAHREEEQHC